MPFEPKLAGTPLIEVRINGKIYHFLLDTGAGMTAISSATAKACGVKTTSTKGVVTAATGKAIGVNPGIIDTLAIGAMKVYNHPCIILNSKDLKFKILGITVFKIDGIVGWNLLEQLDVTIDSKTQQLTFGPAMQARNPIHNFFWLDQPFIQCTDSAGVDCLFFLDTGANASGIYDTFLSKTDTTKAVKKTIAMGSAGGFQRMKEFIFPRLKFIVSGQPLVMKNISEYPHPSEATIVACDGTFGIGELKQYTIHFNMPKGFFTLTN